MTRASPYLGYIEQLTKEVKRLNVLQKQNMQDMADIRMYLEDAKMVRDYIIDLSRLIHHNLPEWKLKPLSRKKQHLRN